MQWQKIHRFEKASCQHYNQVAVVSEADRNIFCNSYFCSNVTVVPNGVDERYFAPVKHQVRPFSMVFTGSLDWRPNQDSVRYFLEAIFPLIRKQLPEATFTVVGRRPPVWLNELAARTSGVTITGAVADVRPYLTQNVLYVVPVRGGLGSRADVLAALSMEMIVLSTTEGVQGLEVKDGTHLILQDGPDAFAEAAIEILTSPVNFRNLGQAGRRLVYDKYTWDQIALKMENVWLKAVKA
jgi:glycosyltransferase involved in cell wall biosynthesis